MNDKFYKEVQVYDKRLFSSNGSIADIARIIKKYPKFVSSRSVEYKPGKWTRTPKIGSREYKRLLFVYKGMNIPTGPNVYECEVKDPVHISEINFTWPPFCNIYLCTAVKLIKRINRNSYER